jgi:hypothetical protein
VVVAPEREELVVRDERFGELVLLEARLEVLDDYEDGADLSRRGGVLVHAPEFPGLEAPALALIGPTAVIVDAQDLDQVLAGLPRFGDDAPPPGGLPNAQLPKSIWRTRSPWGGSQRLRTVL